MNITVSGYTWVWISRLMMPYTQQTGLLKGYVLLTQWRFWGESQFGLSGPQWLEIARKGGWSGFVLCLECGLGLMCKEDHMV